MFQKVFGLSVCLRQTKTPTSGGHGDLWSKIVFLTLVWDGTIFQKEAVFFSLDIVNTRGFAPHPPPKHKLLEMVEASVRRSRS